MCDKRKVNEIAVDVTAAYTRVHEALNALERMIRLHPAMCDDAKQLFIRSAKALHEPVLDILRDKDKKRRTPANATSAAVVHGAEAMAMEAVVDSVKEAHWSETFREFGINFNPFTDPNKLN
jgi:hypothetical protein